MPNDPFQSSDSIRGARPLRYAKSVTFEQPLKLERDGTLPGVTVAYETYGTLNAAKDNAVLICHALSGDSHVAMHDANDDPGWWDLVVGPGKAIDTDRYFVICPNVLGGCRGTTGPQSANPSTGKRYGAEFPIITLRDMVEVQKQLIDHLGIAKLLAVVGGSLGGHMTLTWATHYPDRLLGAAALATSPRLTSQALAFDVVGRNAILTDPSFHHGQYYDQPDKPTDGLAIARMLGHITYLSQEAMTRKFDPQRLVPRKMQTDFETRFAVGSYLAHQGNKFVERFDANSYITLTMAMDLFDLGDTQQHLAEALAPATCKWLLVSFTSDWLFPPFQSRHIVDALISMDKKVSYCNIISAGGHDAFLLPDELHLYGDMLRSFLSNLQNEKPAGVVASSVVAEPSASTQTSIFHEQRLDYDTILSLIPPGASVLDLGCGSGGLLARLKQSGHHHLMGVELDQEAIGASLRHGLDVVQWDLNKGLSAFADRQFDVVVLSQTLQTVIEVERIIQDMLRIGRMAIVSFPNMAYRELREMLHEQGKAPRAGDWLGYDWYNSPNVRFLSILDFQEFCRDRGIAIVKQIALNTREHREIADDPNRNADVAVALISR